jgi:predicted short-subunit dehydrogenase-like oxidoreductase (DUF2520 family)
LGEVRRSEHADVLMRVAVLGLGRLGGSLLPLLRAAGVDAVGWRRGEPMPEADVYWITVGDPAVPVVAAQVPAGRIVLHAAGAAGPELIDTSVERGVLHPLMTFPGVEVGLPELRGAGARVAGTDAARAAARWIAERLGMRPFEVDPARTTEYHAAACLAAGHLGALFLTAAEVLTRAGVTEEQARALLYPLAAESLRRAAEAGAGALTGPAVRGDVTTEARHVAALTPTEAEVYTDMAARIRTLRLASIPNLFAPK